MVPRAAALLRELSAHLRAGESRGELVREGVRVVLYGPPNAGKSSILNALAGRDVAIVSPTAGTTRDAIDVALDLGGVKARAQGGGLTRLLRLIQMLLRRVRSGAAARAAPAWLCPVRPPRPGPQVNLTDTAGLRDAPDAVEGEGIARAITRVRAAHVRVLVLDLEGLSQGARDGASRQPGPGGGAWLRALREHGGSAEAADIVVLNKSDAVIAASERTASKGLAEAPPGRASGGPPEPLAELDAIVQRARSSLAASSSAAGAAASGGAPPAAYVVSCRTGEGIDELCAALRRAAGRVLEAGSGPSGEGGEAVTRLRHRQHLAEAVAALGRCFSRCAEPFSPRVANEIHLRASPVSYRLNDQ